jgi:hypothetical protein
MKFKLVQDSYTKEYSIHQWHDNTFYSSIGKPPTISGYWTVYSDPTPLSADTKETYIKGIYRENERDRAIKDFNHLVNKYSSIERVILEADTSKKLIHETSDTTEPFIVKTWKQKINYPEYGICTVKECTQRCFFIDSKMEPLYLEPISTGKVNVFKGTQFVLVIPYDYAVSLIEKNNEVVNLYK